MTNEKPDRSVYIRRRLIVLGVLVVAVVAVALVIWRPGSGSATQDVAEIEVPDDLAEEADPDEMLNCSASNLVVTPQVSQGTYESGDVPQFSLTVENIGDEECVADLGTAHMHFVLTSGSDEVWRSADCQTNADVRPVILAAGEALETETVEWDRTRSNPETCDDVRDPVNLGGSTYHLSATVAGVASKETASFLLY